MSFFYQTHAIDTQLASAERLKLSIGARAVKEARIQQRASLLHHLAGETEKHRAMGKSRERNTQRIHSHARTATRLG